MSEWIITLLYDDRYLAADVLRILVLRAAVAALAAYLALGYGLGWLVVRMLPAVT